MDIIRKERLATGYWRKKAWLVLAPDRLFFTQDANATNPAAALWEIPVQAIHNVRAKKAFRHGIDVLEVEYTSPAGKPVKKSFERGSLAQWSHGIRGRIEANSLAGWEQSINEARLGTTPGSGAAINLADQLAGLASLQASGALTDDEFRAAKQRLIG
jgi:hypothetical protein